MEVDGIEIENINPIPPLESLDEKEVYAFFGLASYAGQCLEKGMVNFAMAYRLLDDSALSQEEWISLYDSFNAKTFGHLLKVVKSRVDTPEAIISNLEKSVKKRNWLAHDFFYDRAVHFNDSTGREKMIRELQDLIFLFQVTDRMIDTVYMRVWESFGVTEEWINKEMELQFQEYHDARKA